MTTLVLEADPAITDVHVDADTLSVTLKDGRQLRVPLTWSPRLAAGSQTERENWELLGNGYGVAWSDLDEHAGVEGLLAGRRSSEIRVSLERWLRARAVT